MDDHISDIIEQICQSSFFFFFLRVMDFRPYVLKVILKYKFTETYKKCTGTSCVLLTHFLPVVTSCISIVQYQNPGWFTYTVLSRVQIRVITATKIKIKNCATRLPWWVQWLRLHLAMCGMQVRFLIQEDPTCCGAAKPMPLEPMLGNERSHRNEKPTNHSQRKAHVQQ